MIVFISSEIRAYQGTTLTVLNVKLFQTIKQFWNIVTIKVWGFALMIKGVKLFFNELYVILLRLFTMDKAYGVWLFIK